jgi:hypothetical protein
MTKNSVPRETGKDSVPWIVVGATSKPITVKVKDKTTASFEGFKDADFAARTHTRDTGEFARAIRS